MRPRLHAAALLTFTFVLVATPAARAQTASFNDATFINADWSITTELLNLGGSVTGTQVATGGTSGPYRRIDNTLNSAIGFGFSNTVFGFHARAGALFNPATNGPISAIDYSESSIRLAAGVQACGVALRQGGVIYYGPGFVTPSTLNVWVATAQPGLTAASFDAAAPGVQNPDFSNAGGPIQFGFYRSNSTSVGGGGSTLLGGIDDWSVTVHYDGATPSQSASWGAIKSRYAGTR